MKIKKITILFLFLLFLSSYSNAKENLVKRCFKQASQQLTPIARLSPEKDGYPRTVDMIDKSTTFTHLNDWTEGFFPGSLWYLYEYTHDEKWKNEAIKWTIPLEKQQFLTSTHDIGFMMYCSYGNAYRLTKNKQYKDILVQSAKSLCTRFTSATGVIKSWNYRESWDKKHKWYYPVIIDNMMNLELLYFATKVTGDSTYAKVANSHADITLKNHFRQDFSSYHVVNYDPKNGKVLFRGTCQGYADNSTWARGQAWAIYGYTMVYRETKNPKYLHAAKKMADFWLSNFNLPKDMIPYWDFDAINKDCQPADWAKERPYNFSPSPRDASAAAVTCSALFELSTYLEDGKKYYDAAVKTLHSLASPEYFARNNTNGHFLIKHCVGSLPHGAEIDVPLVYADYYFLEALLRYKTLSNSQSSHK